MTETQNSPERDFEADCGPKLFDVTLYRSGFVDITIRLAAKDSTQACQKAIKAYGSWNVVRVRNVKEKPQPETLAALIKQALGGTHDLAEVVTRAYNAGYEDHVADVGQQQRVPEYPYISDLGEHVIIGPECFSDKAEQSIMWKGRHYAATSDAPDAELLEKISTATAGALDFPTTGDDAARIEKAIQDAYNVGFISGRRGIDGGGEDTKVDQAGFEEWASEVVAIEPAIGMAEESEEGKRFRLQRRADQAELIDWILNYKNPADEETRMRQIRVVMD